MAKCEVCGRPAGLMMQICMDCERIRDASRKDKSCKCGHALNSNLNMTYCDACGEPLDESNIIVTPDAGGPPIEREGLSVASQVTEGVKVVPFSAAPSSGLAAQVENIIRSHEAEGWRFVGVHQLQSFTHGSNGCFGMGATPPTPTTVEFIVFRR